MSVNEILRDRLLAAFRAWNSKAPTTADVTAGALLEQSGGGRSWLDLLPPEDLGSRLRPTWWGRIVLLLEEATGEPCVGRFAGVEYGYGSLNATYTPGDDRQAPVAVDLATVERVGGVYIINVRLLMESAALDRDAGAEADFLRSMEPRR